MKTSSKYILVFDLETGGLPSKNKKAFDDIALIELSCSVIDMETLVICEEVDVMFEYDYKEGLEYNAQAEAVHGISKDMMKSKGRPLKENFKIWKDLFKKYKNPRQGITMVAHNHNFDRLFLENWFKHMGADLSEDVKYWIDTMQLSHMTFLEADNYQLHTCCNTFGIDLVDAHRSNQDTHATALLMIEYIKRLRNTSSTETTNQTTVKQSCFRDTFQL